MIQAPRATTRKLLATASLALLVGCGQQITADEYLEKARQHLASGAYSAATVELNNALQADPQHAQARWLSAQSALALGDGQKAERDARRALEQGISPSDVQPVLVRALFLQAEIDKVLAETSIPPREAPPALVAELTALRGTAHLFKNDLDTARQEFEKALKLDPHCPEALHGFALLMSLRGAADAAREWIQKAIDAAPSNADAWTLLGDLELEAGNYGAAESAFTKAIDNRAYVTLDRAKRAFARIRQDKLQEAEADLRPLSQQRLNHYYADYVRGILAFREARLNDAANAFEASFNANPDFAPNRVYLATTRLLTGQPEQALSHAEFIRRIAPHSAEAARLLGAIQINRSDYAAARRALETALEMQPNDTAALQMLFSTSLLEGNRDKGLSYAKRLAALLPDSEDAHNALMLAQLMSGEALSASDPQPRAADTGYRNEFIRALAAFRDNRFAEARELVQALRATHPNETDPINLSAAIHLATGRWADAKHDLESVLQRKPNDGNSRKNLARIALQEGDAQRARALLQPLAPARPIDETAIVLLATTQMRLGEDKQAVALLEDALRAQPTAHNALAMLARLHLAQGEPSKALERLRGLGAAQLEQMPIFFELRGRAQMASGDFNSARATFDHWARFAPTSGAAHYWLAESLGRVGDLPAARTALTRALEVAPQYLPARIGELRMLTLAGSREPAAAAAKRLETDFGPTREVLAATGWHALATGNFAVAEEKLRAAFDMAPDSELVVLLARALWGQEKHDETFAHLNEWLRAHPADPAALLHLAGAHLSLQQNDKAVSTYRRMLEHHPNHVPSINNVAWLIRKDRADEALQLARRAHELSPQDPFVLDTLGMLYFERKDLQQANWFLTQALELNPNDGQLRLHVAQVLIEQGKHKEARDLLVKVIEDSSGTPLEIDARKLLDQAGGRG